MSGHIFLIRHRTVLGDEPNAIGKGVVAAERGVDHSLDDATMMRG
jgi:hypothetical protein